IARITHFGRSHRDGRGIRGCAPLLALKDHLLSSFKLAVCLHCSSSTSTPSPPWQRYRAHTAGNLCGLPFAAVGQVSSLDDLCRTEGKHPAPSPGASSIRCVLGRR